MHMIETMSVNLKDLREAIESLANGTASAAATPLAPGPIKNQQKSVEFHEAFYATTQIDSTTKRYITTDPQPLPRNSSLWISGYDESKAFAVAVEQRSRFWHSGSASGSGDHPHESGCPRSAAVPAH